MDKIEAALRAVLSRRVRRVRQQKKLSLWDAGEKAGIHWRHIQKIEAGEANVTIQTIARLARALDVAPVELLRAGTDQGRPNSTKRKR